MPDRPAVRCYSEREHPFGPPVNQGHGSMRECAAHGRPHDATDCGCELVPVVFARDDRMWMSVEWAAERGFEVPEDWRELA